MKKFEAFMNRWFLPFSERITKTKPLIAVRDAFLQLIPFTLAGSMVVVLNVVFFSPDGFIGQYLVKVFPNISVLEGVLSPVLTGTTTVMSLFVVFLTARNLANLYDPNNGNKAGITALTVFFIFYPVTNLESGSFLDTTYLGSNGLFVAIFLGLIIGWTFSKLSNYDKLLIKMPDSVPYAVAQSFNVVIPIIIILIISSAFSFTVTLLHPNGLNDLIYTVLQKPLTLLGSNAISILILEFFALLLWAFGIHGTATVFPITRIMFTEANLVNLEYVAQFSTTRGAPYPFTWQSIFEQFGSIGGTGNTLGLIIAILICTRMKNWKRDDYTTIAKMSVLPGLFTINEPIIFGLPIVLNPLLMIPFILSPIVNSLIGMLEVYSGFVPPAVLDSGWATPQPIKAFLATSGAWQSIVSQIVALAIATLIYLPFVMMSNKVSIEGENKND